MPSRTRLRRMVSRSTRAQAPRRHRLRDAQLGQRAGEARHVPRLVDEAAILDLAHLVHGVGELEAAILRVHGSVRIRARTGR